MFLVVTSPMVMFHGNMVIDSYWKVVTENLNWSHFLLETFEVKMGIEEISAILIFSFCFKSFCGPPNLVFKATSKAAGLWCIPLADICLLLVPPVFIDSNYSASVHCCWWHGSCFIILHCALQPYALLSYNNEHYFCHILRVYVIIQGWLKAENGSWRLLLPHCQSGFLSPVGPLGLCKKLPKMCMLCGPH